MGMLTTVLLAAALAVPLDVRSFQVLARDSGPENYYRVIDPGAELILRGIYSPPLQTVTLFAPLPDRFRNGVRRIRWRWRAIELPSGGNECVEGRGDSAAAVYVTWKRGLRWYSLKFVWSTAAPLGATCNSIRNPFVASDSIVLRSGGGGSRWVEEEIDPAALFRQHFGGEVPELQGLGILTDGDQTRSTSAADYAGFELTEDASAQRPAPVRSSPAGHAPGRLSRRF